MTTPAKPISISWSSLKRWEECAHKDLRYKQGKQQSVVDGRVFLPGTIADRVMRKWLDSEDPQPGQMLEMIEDIYQLYAHPKTEEERQEAQYVIRWRGDKSADQKTVKEFVTEVITKLEPILLREVVPFDYQPELKFRTTIGIPYLDGKITGIDLTGGIDIAVRFDNTEDKGRFRLYDLKATTNPSYMNATVGQSIFYDIAFGTWIGDRAQPEAFGFIAPALPQQLQWSVITDDDRRAMLARIIACAHGQWQDKWDPKASDEGCKYCEVSHVCPKWAIKTRRDEKGRNRASFTEAAAKRKELRDANAG